MKNKKEFVILMNKFRSNALSFAINLYVNTAKKSFETDFSLPNNSSLKEYIKNSGIIKQSIDMVLDVVALTGSDEFQDIEHLSSLKIDGKNYNIFEMLTEKEIEKRLLSDQSRLILPILKRATKRAKKDHSPKISELSSQIKSLNFSIEKLKEYSVGNPDDSQELLNRAIEHRDALKSQLRKILILDEKEKIDEQLDRVKDMQMKATLEAEYFIMFIVAVVQALNFVVKFALYALMDGYRQLILAEAKLLYEQGETVMIQIRLSKNHDIFDICDYNEGDYIFPKLPSDGLPPYHFWCECDLDLVIL